MADPTTSRPSKQPRRRAHVKYVRRQNSFARVVREFNATLEERFPLVPYRDCIGRSRVAGRARRRRAQGVLQVLIGLQVRARSGIVYAGYQRLGAEMHCSRSTAYRGVKDLRGAELLDCHAGGGKTHDEVGNLVDAANGYLVPKELSGPEERQGRKPKLAKTPRAGGLGPRGRELAAYAEEALERHRARAGPGP